MYLRAHVYTDVYTCVHMYMYIRICTVYIRMHARTCMCACLDTYVHVL
jgi:hypothetical protein